jgi:hypothetical protein
MATIIWSEPSEANDDRVGEARRQDNVSAALKLSRDPDWPGFLVTG